MHFATPAFLCRKAPWILQGGNLYSETTALDLSAPGFSLGFPGLAKAQA